MARCLLLLDGAMAVSSYLDFLLISHGLLGKESFENAAS